MLKFGQTILGAGLLGLVTLGFAASAQAAPGAKPPVPPSQQAVCGAVPAGYSRCLAHLLKLSASTRRSGPSKPGGPGGPGGSVTDPTPTGLPPVAITTAYGFPTTGGSGETVGIVDAYDDPNIASDLSTFSSQYNLPSCTSSNGCFTKVNQTGGNKYPQANSSWALEISLDVEWVHAVAPDARIVLVEASSNSDSDLFAAVSYASKHSNYVSMSWGGPEFSGESSYDSYFTGSGVSYFAASGDSGAGAEYPSSSPDVVSVGGTTLNLSLSGGTYSFVSETDWSGGGGGCSAYETASTAQAGFATYPQVNCGGKRATPDASLDADPNTGVSVYDSVTTSGQSGWFTVGGTSASTQMWAAESAVSTKQMTSSYLYEPNLPYYPISACTNGEPSVNSGYDLCTGLGSWSTARGTINGSSGGGSTSAPAAPTGVNATAGDSQVTVSWTASTGASSYTVYDGTTSTSIVNTGCTTAATSCTVGSLLNGTTYYFDVVATNSTGPSPASSPPASATPEATTTQTISVSAVTYSTSGPHSANLDITISLDPAISAATVAISVDLNGSLESTGSGTTSSDGTITFVATNAPKGTYTTTVTQVSATGYTWNETTPPNSYSKK